MKLILFLTGVITLLTSGCVVSENRWHGHERYHGHTHVIVPAPVVVVPVPVVRVRVE